MKSKFGTALALVAVLLTGTAAAAINTQALISPTESTLGTAATTLLPADQTIATVPGQTPVVAVTPNNQTPGVTASQTQASSASVTQPSATSTAAAAAPVVTQPVTSAASTPSKPSVVYGNPNPSNGDDDDDDDDDDEDDD
jgi:hypothetical protein